MKQPKDTESYVFQNANPKNKTTHDCVIRAICTALGQTYEETARELVEVWLKTGYHIADPKCYDKYLKSKGWKKQKQPRKSDNTKYLGKEFARIYSGTYVAHIGGHHIVCITNGKIIDTWDCSNKCIGNYWIKEE